MIGAASRASLRASARGRSLLTAPARRHASFFTPPAHRKRTWKGFALRWGIAIGGVYWYNTSSLFAREPVENWQSIVETAEDNHELPTVDSLTAQRRARQAALASAPPALDAPSPSTTPENSMIASRAVLDEPTGSASPSAAAAADSPQGLEEEAESQGAFNEETGEINWDCPCLGGMAHGPCGPEFREAFSCFVYSKEEPKGVDCIDRFKHMQDCFRAHPDIYGSELTDDAEEEEVNDGAVADAPYSGAKTPADAVPDANLTAAPSASPSTLAGDPKPQRGGKIAETETGNVTGRSESQKSAQRSRAKSAKPQARADQVGSETGESVPKAWHDAQHGSDGQKQR